MITENNQQKAQSMQNYSAYKDLFAFIIYIFFKLSDTKKNFSLNAKEGQRGIVIKNRTGDWGLLRGQWIGFRKGAPATAGKKDCP